MSFHTWDLGILSDRERTLVQTLSVFRRPLRVEDFTALFRETEADVRATLVTLAARQWVTLQTEVGESVCMLPSGLREEVYASLGQEKERHHREARKCYLGKRERPEGYQFPKGLSVLDLHEEAIYHLTHGGEILDAVDQYGVTLGGYRQLAWRLADYARGERITSEILAVGYIEIQSRYLSTKPWYDRCLYRLNLGKLTLAEMDLHKLLEHARYGITPRTLPNMGSNQRPRHRSEDLSYGDDSLTWMCYQGAVEQSLCDTLVALGKLPDAERLASAVLATGTESRWCERGRFLYDTGTNPFARRAHARALLGHSVAALADFRMARTWKSTDNNPLFGPFHSSGGWHVALHGSLLLRLGNLQTAAAVLRRCNAAATWPSRPLLAAVYELTFADLHRLRGDLEQASQATERALVWANGSGHQETIVRAMLSKGRLAARGESWEKAAEFGAEAERVARRCEFRLWLIDVLVLRGHVALAQGRAEEADRAAKEAHELASAPRCWYRWGIGDALHLRAEVALKMGKKDVARTLAETAVTQRDVLQDPKRANTRRLLARLRA